MTTMPLEPRQQTQNLSNYFAAVRVAAASKKVTIRGPRLAHQEGNLLSATATYRDSEGVWHDLAIAFLPHADGGLRLTVQGDIPGEAATPERLAAVKHLSEIVRSAIPVHREHVAAATELGQNPAEASGIIIRHLIDCSAGHLGYAIPAAYKNGRHPAN